MPKVSIVIVSWNARRFLQDCLQSIYDTAADMPLEVIVVDNASNDGSPQIVSEQFPMARLIRNETNLGFARANNIGMRASTGQYVCLINSDVVVLKNCLHNLGDFMDNHPRVGMAGPRILNSDGTLQPSCRRFPTLFNSLCSALALDRAIPRSGFFSGPFMKWWPHDSVRSVEGLSGCFWIVRREALDVVGMLDESFFIYGEDIDWCKRFHDARWEVMFVPDAEAVHFGGASSANAPVRFYVEMCRANAHYWRKHHGRIGAGCYGAIVLLHETLRLAGRGLQIAVRPSASEELSYNFKRSVACLRWLLHI